MMIDYLDIPLDERVGGILLLLSTIVLVMITATIAFGNYDFLTITIKLSIFSIFISITYLLLDAPDVSMTEASVGSCISTILLLSIVKILKEDQSRFIDRKFTTLRWVSLFFSLTLIIILGWIGLDLPNFGSSHHLDSTEKYYFANKEHIKIPSLVASILASFRAFDTLGETLVILIAGLSVVLLTSNKRDDL